MASFDYNPFADSVSLAYKCPHCCHENLETIEVPSPDWCAESHNRSINTDGAELVCAKCGSEYNVQLATGIYGGEGEIYAIDEIISCIENIPGEDEDYYDKQLYDVTHTDIDKLLDASASLPNEVKPMLYKLLYANAITMMETYLGDTLKREVLKDEASMRSFVENYKPFKEIEIRLSDLFFKRDALPQYICETLSSILFHDLRKIKPIYKDVLNIDIDDVRDLYRAVFVRHDIVHRNGFDKEGKEHVITKEDVQQFQDKVQKLIEQVNYVLVSRQDSICESALEDAAEHNLFPFDL